MSKNSQNFPFYLLSSPSSNHLTLSSGVSSGENPLFPPLSDSPSKNISNPSLYATSLNSFCVPKRISTESPSFLCSNSPTNLSGQNFHSVLTAVPSSSPFSFLSNQDDPSSPNMYNQTIPLMPNNSFQESLMSFSPFTSFLNTQLKDNCFSSPSFRSGSLTSSLISNTSNKPSYSQLPMLTTPPPLLSPLLISSTGSIQLLSLNNPFFFFFF
jgi:hypothetical protein